METKDRVMLKASATTKNASNPVNGSAKVANGSEAKANAEQAKAEPEPVKAKEEPKPTIQMLPVARAADRLGKFEQFQKLGERFAFLKDKDRELKNFTVAQDGTLAKITLDCPGGNVVISNSLIIEKVVKVCQTELDALLVKTEAEVIEFEI